MRGGRGLCRRRGRADVARQALHRPGQLVFDPGQAGRAGMAGVGHAILAGGAPVGAEHLLRMFGEGTVHRHRRLAVLLRQHLHQVGPRQATCRLVSSPTAEEQHVDHDLGARRRQHGSFRHPDRAHQVGQRCNVLARLRVGLVHRVSAGHEGREAARLQPLDAPGDEVVMQAEAQPAGGVLGPHRAIRERRVAHHQVEGLRQPGLGEVLVPDPGLGVEQPGDPRRGRVHLDAGRGRPCRHLLRHHRQEQSRAAAGLQHAAALEAHAR